MNTASMPPYEALARRSKTVQTAAGTLFYYDTYSAGGEEPKPALILIHGLGDEADSFRHIIPLLAERYRVLALDLPGFGRSSARNISLTQHRNAVLRLLEISGAAILAGSSMGGIIAELAAMKKPELVRALIFIDGGLPLAAKLNPGLLVMALPFFGRRFYRGLRGKPDAAYETLRPYYADLDALGEDDRRFLYNRVAARVNSGAQEKAYFASLRSLIWHTVFGGGRFRRFFARFRGSITIIWGEQDAVFTPEAAALMRKLRPDAAFSLIPGAGHLPHQEKPAETAGASLALRLRFA